VASVITIHNIAFQGWAPGACWGCCACRPSSLPPDALEYYGGLSSLKAGLVTADAITTVSPDLCRRTDAPEFGMGLQGVIAARAAGCRAS
jgi:starch synthase